MKKSLLNYFILLLASFSCFETLNSQDSSKLKVGCPDPANPEGEFGYLLGEDEGIYKLRVTFLVDDVDEGVLSYSECEQVMTMLYEAYNDYNISFLWDRKIDNYNSSADDLYHAINQRD
ncbi:MAG: hypothetical protein ACJATI_002895 [Halioglobus sp.]|jgi:hypothetical protein